MPYSVSSQTNNPLYRKQPRNNDYIKIRLLRMVRSVLKEDLNTDNSCLIPVTLNDNEQHVFLKGLWLVLLGMCIVVFTYQSYDRISHFLTYPVAVDVFIISPSIQHFPEVTICYPYTEEVLDVMDKYKASYNLPSVISIITSAPGKSTEEIWNLVNTSRAIVSAKEIKGKQAVPLEYTGIPLNMGMCTTVQSTNSRKLNKKGDHYLEIAFKRSLQRNTGSYVEVFIHDHGDPPMMRQKFLLPSIMDSQIAITKRQFHFENRTDSPCTLSSDLRDCMANCLMKFIIQIGATKCRFPFYPQSMKNISNYCLASRDTAKYWGILLNYMSGVSKSGPICSCVRKCDHTTFTKQQTTHKSNSTTMRFVLHHDSIYETIIQERLCYSLISLFCDIGGNSGLFIGISLLSVFQLGHLLAARFKKAPSQFSTEDPLYRKVLKTYFILRKQGKIKHSLPTKNFGKVAKVFKNIVISTCIGLLVASVGNRVLHFFQYPLQTIVDITFNMSLETPSIILCPGNPDVMKLRQQVSNSRKISNPCEVNIWELFDLPGVNCSHVWSKIEMKTPKTFSGPKSEDVYFPIDFYDGSCFDMNDGSLRIPPNKMLTFCSLTEPQCGTFYQIVYIRSSTGHIDYYHYEHIAFELRQQLIFIFKEIRIDESGIPCVSSEENEECIRTCLTKKLFHQTDCRLPYMPEANLPLCRSSSSVRRAHLAFRDLFFAFGSTKDCNCSPKCRTRFLEVSHFIEEQPTTKTCYLFGPGHNVIESYVIQRAYTIVQLLCDVGGLMGSTLGLCILGIMENALSFISQRFNRRGGQ